MSALGVSVANYSPSETAYAALFTKVSNSYGYVLKSRKLRLWGDTVKEERPCLFQHELNEVIVGGDDPRTPPQRVLKANLFIYTWAKDAANPSALLNPLVDAVFYALRPSPMDGKQNLGLAFVQHCWVSGDVFRDPGSLDGDGLAIIPISIRMLQALTYS